MRSKMVQLSCHLLGFLYDFLKTVCKATFYLISLDKFVQISSPINLSTIIIIFLVGDNSQETSIFPYITNICPIVQSIMELVNKQSAILMLVILLLNIH